MATVLFIHGTKTRYDEDYRKTLAQIEKKLKKELPDSAFAFCPWGEFVGARLHADLRSIPGVEPAEATVLGAQPEQHADPAAQLAIVDAELWALLAADPLAELRLLAIERSATDVYGMDSSVGAELADRVRGLHLSALAPELHADLQRAGLADALDQAADLVAAFLDVPGDPQVAAGLQAIPEERRDQWQHAVARAIVASDLQTALAQGSAEAWELPAPLRDQLVDALAPELDDSGVLGGGLLNFVWSPALYAATLGLQAARLPLMKGVAAFMGDILKYQARRADIHRTIAEHIARLESPVILLAHSLGGIACFELLLSTAHLRERVPLLITAGSQIPLLYELDALGALPYQPDLVSLPENFPAWLNLYDRWDLLSFQAASLIDGRYSEHEVRSGKPFPDAHDGYWGNDAVWELIVPAIRSALEEPA